jgi:hypothetical protein
MRRSLKVKVKWQSICAYIGESDFLLPSQAKRISATQWPSDVLVGDGDDHRRPGGPSAFGERVDFDLSSSLDSLFLDSAGTFSTLEYEGDTPGQDMHPAKFIKDQSQDRKGNGAAAEGGNAWFSLAPGPRAAARSRPSTQQRPQLGPRAHEDAAKSDVFVLEPRESPWFATGIDPWRPMNRVSGQRGRNDALAPSTCGHERMEYPTISQESIGSSAWFRTGPCDFVSSMWGQPVDRKTELD